ncbi:retropepsin-like aspartic protease [soil metagenome]
MAANRFARFGHGAARALAWLVMAVVIYAGMRAYERWEAETRVLVVTQGDETQISIRRDRDGHYRLPGTVNGEPVNFMIDTGATRTVVPQAVAQRARLARTGSDIAKTAAGSVRFELAVADIGLGGSTRIDALKVSISPSVGTEALLGMDVLGALRFEQDGNVLRIDAVSRSRRAP